MPLYLITTDTYNYDEYDAFVIRADNEDQVRKKAYAAASYRASDEDAQGWLTTATVEEIEPYTYGAPPEVILASFNAG